MINKFIQFEKMFDALINEHRKAIETVIGNNDDPKETLMLQSILDFADNKFVTYHK